jgi:hypothetical protein
MNTADFISKLVKDYVEGSKMTVEKANDIYSKLDLEQREAVRVLCSVEHNKFEIKEIIINEPAMIVFWKDGTKTVVKAQDGETFDEEKGLSMAYAKKALGNNYAAFGRFKQRLKHAKRVNKAADETDISKIPICKEIMDEAMRRLKAEMEADTAKEDIIKLDDLIPGKLPDVFEDKS